MERGVIKTVGAAFGRKIVLGIMAVVIAASSVTTQAFATSPYVLSRSGTEITVDWQDDPQATDYEVVVFENGAQVEVVNTSGVSEFHDTNTLPNVTYQYAVSAIRPVVNEEPPVDEEPPVEEEPPLEEEQTDPGQTEEQGDPEEGEPEVLVTTETVLLFKTTAYKYALSALTASARLTTHNSITLNYTSVYGVTNYEVYRSTKKTTGYKKIATVTGVSYVNKSLALNTTYYYKVRGVQKVGASSFYTNWSSVVSKRTALGKTTPKVTKTSYNGVALSWTKVEGASGYKVYRSTHKTKNFKHIKSTSSLAYTNGSLNTGTRYYYKIVPYKGKVNGPASAVVSALPSLKSGSIAYSTVALGQVTIHWNKVSGASGYKLYRATSKNGSYKLVKTTKGLSHTDKKLANNKIYYYKVRPYRMVGKKTVLGGASAAEGTITPRKAGMYYANSDAMFVLKTSGYGYYSVCANLTCNWSYDINDSFENRAYVYVPAGYYLTFEAFSKSAHIIPAAVYYNTPKKSFASAGQYLVGVDLAPGTYKLTSSKYYYYSVCETMYCEWGSGYDDNDLLYNGGTRYVYLQEGDFLTISGTVKGARQ